MGGSSRHRALGSSRRGSVAPSSDSSSAPQYALVAAGVIAAAAVWSARSWLKRRFFASARSASRQDLGEQSCPLSNNPVIPPAILEVVERIAQSERQDPFSTVAPSSGSSHPQGATGGRPHAEFPLPTVLVDLAAFRANVAAMARVALAHGKKVRIGTKSIRVPALIELAADVVEAEARQVLQQHLADRQGATALPATSGSAAAAAATATATATLSNFVRVDELDDELFETADCTNGGGGSVPLGGGALPSAVSGLMTYSATETLFWARRCTSGTRLFSSLLLAYPIADTASAHLFVDAILANSSQRVTCTVAVDAVAQLLVLADAAMTAIRNERYLTVDGFDGAGATLDIHVVVDVDMSYHPKFMGRDSNVHLGVYRSPIRTPEDVVRLLEGIESVNEKCHHAMRGEKIGVRFVVDGILGYEAQVAGLQDFPFGRSPLSPVSKAMRYATQTFKQTSMRDILVRRAACVEAVKQFAPSHHHHQVARESILVNGGGSGSVSYTSHDHCVTEITIGSGALCGHLFDRFALQAAYEPISFIPAIFLAIGVSRVAASTEAKHVVVCQGGGCIASGPPGADRAPIVVYPSHGVTPIVMEGFGEVQTPLLQHIMSDKTKRLTYGDVVLLRPAKSGEIAEHFSEYLLVDSNTDVGGEPSVVVVNNNEANGGVPTPAHHVVGSMQWVPTYRGMA